MAILNSVFLDRLKHTVRKLGRTPMFTIVTLITLAVGVGANTIIFSVLEGVLLKPLPYPHAEQLIGVWHTAPGIGIKDLNMAPFVYFVDREQSTTLQDIGAFTGDSVTITGAGEPEHVQGMDVTSGTLPILGVQPVLGRLFTQRDDSQAGAPTVLISHAYWQKKFGGDRSVIGRSITVDGTPREIIGVLPRDFQFMDAEDRAIFMPMQWDRNKTKLGNFSFEALARMKPGVTIEQASADMRRLLPIAIRSFPAPEGFSAKIFESAGIAPNLRPLKQDVVGDVGKVLWVLMGSIGAVLLIACANVANLLLVRVEGRRQELAICSALGAGWRRIAGDLLMESVVLGLTGSAIGLAIAFGALRILLAVAPTGLPRIHEIGIDPMVLLFTLALALFTSLLIGSIPVLKFAGAQLNASLREGGRGQSQSREQHRARSILVVLQVALALVLLIFSGLMIRTFSALSHVDPGFTGPDQLQTFRLFIPESEVKDSAQVPRREQEILNRIAAIPGVSSVAFNTALPMSGNSSNDPVFAQDRTYADGELPPIRRFKFVSPGYFKTAGTAMVAGRDITWDETYNKVPVAIVSENLAREYWHDPRNAIGKRIRVATSDDWREVIGVVRDVYDDGVDKPATSAVYWPVYLAHFEGQPEQERRGVYYIVRTGRAGAESLVQEIQRAVWSLNSNVPLYDIHTLAYYFNRSMARTSFTLVMLCVAAGMALLLGFVGIYGVIAYSVSQRTREIGIRMALGAQRGSITGMFVRHGLLLTGIGVACGLGASAAVMQLMSSLLFHVNPIDPLTYGTITAAIVGIAWIACYLPSRRAATVEPVHALRGE